MKITREDIKDFVARKPEAEIEAGIFVRQVGTKWVHMLNTWARGSNYKIALSEFARLYMVPSYYR